MVTWLCIVCRRKKKGRGLLRAGVQPLTIVHKSKRGHLAWPGRHVLTRGCGGRVRRFWRPLFRDRRNLCTSTYIGAAERARCWSPAKCSRDPRESHVGSKRAVGHGRNHRLELQHAWPQTTTLACLMKLRSSIEWLVLAVLAVLATAAVVVEVAVVVFVVVVDQC